MIAVPSPQHLPQQLGELSATTTAQIQGLSEAQVDILLQLRQRIDLVTPQQKQKLLQLSAIQWQTLITELINLNQLKH